jgi:hypothetical protein
MSVPWAELASALGWRKKGARKIQDAALQHMTLARVQSAKLAARIAETWLEEAFGDEDLAALPALQNADLWAEFLAFIAANLFRPASVETELADAFARAEAAILARDGSADVAGRSPVVRQPSFATLGPDELVDAVVRRLSLAPALPQPQVPHAVAGDTRGAPHVVTQVVGQQLVVEDAVVVEPGLAQRRAARKKCEVCGVAAPCLCAAALPAGRVRERGAPAQPQAPARNAPAAAAATPPPPPPPAPVNTRKGPHNPPPPPPPPPDDTDDSGEDTNSEEEDEESVETDVAEGESADEELDISKPRFLLDHLSWPALARKFSDLELGNALRAYYSDPPPGRKYDHKFCVENLLGLAGALRDAPRLGFGKAEKRLCEVVRRTFARLEFFRAQTSHPDGAATLETELLDANVPSDIRKARRKAREAQRDADKDRAARGRGRKQPPDTSSRGRGRGARRPVPKRGGDRPQSGN